MSSQIDAISRLFRDDDPETVELVKEQLVLRGETAVGDLRNLVNADSAIVAAHAQEVLHVIAGKKASEKIESLCTGSGEIPLEDACWLISEALMPWIDTEDSRAIIDSWGRELLHRVSENPEARVALLIEYLHGELGFDGNARDYYNHENSLLPCVLENRKGASSPLQTVPIFLRVSRLNSATNTWKIPSPVRFSPACWPISAMPMRSRRQPGRKGWSNAGFP